MDSSPSPTRHALSALRKHPTACQTQIQTQTQTYTNANTNTNTNTNRNSNLASTHPSFESIPNNSPVSGPLLPDQAPSRRSTSSSLQLHPPSLTPPGAWSVPGKLVRKKASGLIREAARSWGRSKSKEVLSFGLGVLIGNQDPSSNMQTTTATTSTSTIHTAPHQHTPDQAIQSQSHPNPNSVGIVIKGPKKRISFHGTKKAKGKTAEHPKLGKRRSEIGFGDWADTLNTAVASSSPQPFPSDNSDCSTATHRPHPCPPSNPNPTTHHLSPDPSMAISLRRRDRSFNLSHNPLAIPPAEPESFSSAATSRVPRSTFPHAHRSPRSPRRFYNTRAAVQRNQSSLHPLPEPFFVLGTNTPLAHTTHLTQYQQSAPLTSSPFKRSVSPINQFEDDFDVESPIASKSHGRAPLASELQLRAARSARANLFGAMPNRSGGLEPTPSSSSFSLSCTPQAMQTTHQLPPWSNGPPVNPPNPAASVPRSRQRTVSATLQEHSSRLQAQYLTTLSENGCDSDPEVSKSGFDSPSSSPSRSPTHDLIHSQSSSSSVSMKTGHQNNRVQSERWVMPRIEGLDMTPRRPSLDGSCEDSDPDEKDMQVGSSKSSSTTSILSCLTTQEPRSRITSGPSNSSLKTSLGGFDAFGALPPPESPFPGAPRFKRAGPSASPASPNKLKRDVDGELVGFASQPNLYRHRINAPVPTCSLPSLRFKTDPFELAHPSQRDSWGQQSNFVSDDDEDGPGVADHHDREAINGSHESHEGTSNLSVPGLTDSSSLASSLASSNQSSNAHNIRHPVDSVALLSNTWDRSSKETGREAKRRSLPTNVGRTPPHNSAPVPPMPLPTHLVTSDSSFQENESSFQNVKPNASAFLSSGMISKKTVAQGQRDISLGSNSTVMQYASLSVGAPDVSLNEENKTLSTEDSVAAKSMCEALGGPRVLMAALHEDQSRQMVEVFYERSISMQSETNPDSTSDICLGLVLPEYLRKPSHSSLKMPDTPIKRPFALPKSHPHINKPLIPSGLSKQSNAYSPSIHGSPIDNSPISRSHQFLVPESPIPHFQPKFKPTSQSLISSELSPASPHHDDVDPSPSLNRSTMIGQIPSAFDSVSKYSPMFRRRSSDAVLSNHTGCSTLNKTSGSQSNNPFDETGTPTKVASGWLKRAPQLLTSPSPGSSIYSANNSPSMHHHLQVDQLFSGNSSVEHLVDPQVTPNRTGVRPYSSFLTSPTSGADLRQDSSANMTPGPDDSTSPSSNHPSFSNRYESPPINHNQHQNHSALIDSPIGGRFSTEFDLIRVMGSGEFGEVAAVRSGKPPRSYAIKRAKRSANGPKALARQYEEVDTLRCLNESLDRSPYIMKFVDAWEEHNKLHLQTELCENGTLEHFLVLLATLQDRLDEERIWKITSELAQGVAFMHSHGVLHFDIKPANIFVTAYGGLKIGDFGLARLWPRINPSHVRECGMLNGRHKLYQYVPTNPSNEKADSLIPSRFLRYEDVSDNEERHMMRFKRCGRFVGFDLEREGDREYIAPEILSGRYGEEADVFSVGLIALEISTNVVLPDNGDEWRALRSSDFSRTDLSHLSSELVLLIKRMMDKCPDRRITAEELAQHPVLSKLHGLREVGIAAELERFMRIKGPDKHQFEMLRERVASPGDVQMTRGDTDSIEPARPPPPPGNLWRSARGAVLPEAEGFLPFILTGQSTPSRLKPSTNSAKMTSIDGFLETTQDSVMPVVNDAMEIDV